LTKLYCNRSIETLKLFRARKKFGDEKISILKKMHFPEGV